MVLLTSALRPLNPREVKLQGLEGWSMLVQALAAHAPLQLGGVVNQVGGLMPVVARGGRGRAARACRFVLSLSLRGFWCFVRFCALTSRPACRARFACHGVAAAPAAACTCSSRGHCCARRRWWWR